MVQGTATSFQYRILINSIGSARPSASAAVAKGLGLPISTVVSRLYRAPAVLIDGVEEALATRMVALLNDIGFEAEVQALAEPAPEDNPLYDVSVYIENTNYFLQAVQTLASFTGISEEDSSNMIMSPPGVVLGSVSKATVDAFADQMGANVSVISSAPKTARYDLFLGVGPEVICKRVLEDIGQANLSVLGESGLIATEVDYEVAQDLWRRHQTSNALRIVNRDFLRFDITLLNASNHEIPSREQIKLLESLAGIPADMVGEVFRELPITLFEAVPMGLVSSRVEALAAVDLEVQVNLITFQMLGLKILSIADRSSVLSVLEQFDLCDAGDNLARLPFQLPGVMPELQARIVRTALENTGARVIFVDDCQ